MSQDYAPQRRKVLALEAETPPPPMGLIVPPLPAGAAEPGRQTALSIPEGVRALGEPLEPFFSASGGRQTISLAVGRRDNALSPETYVFQQPFILIGRCQESDLVLPDRRVNFRHVYLQLVAGRWLFVDLGLVSGAVAGEKGRSASGWFDQGSGLAVGPYTVTHLARESASPAELLDDDEPALPVVHLEFVNGRGNSRRGQSRRIAGPVTIVGGSRQCDLWLRDENVSKVHASLVLTPRGLWVVDLLGREGVLVDDRPAYWKQVHDGSLLQIGPFRFRVQFGGAHRQSGRRVEQSGSERRSPAERRSSAKGSLSEESVLAMFQQMTDLQSQFFEHSQLQMEMMAQMLSHLGRSQQASVRQDLTRIDEIGRELSDIKQQLAAPREESPVRPARKKRSRALPKERRPPDRSSLDIPQVSATARAEADRPAEVSSADDLPPIDVKSAPPGRAEEGRKPADLPSAPSDRADDDMYAPPTSSNEAHARLTQRMAKLAQERNSRWRHVLSAFRRKPDRPSDD